MICLAYDSVNKQLIEAAVKESVAIRARRVELDVLVEERVRSSGRKASYAPSLSDDDSESELLGIALGCDQS